MRRLLLAAALLAVLGASACGESAGPMGQAPESTSTAPRVGPTTPPPDSGGGPPPAWVETEGGDFWLGFSSFCWGSGDNAMVCADAAAPSCQDAHTPKMSVRAGEVVRFHIAFRAVEMELAFFPPEQPPLPVEHSPASQQVLPWKVTRGGALALFARAAPAQGGDDASYGACLELSE